MTFNGSLFDLPFLRHEFPDLPLPDAHVDLRFLARRAGLPGPQKKVERQLGFARDDDLAEVDGKVAPVLWHRYRRGERDALMRLIRYNHADIEGMKQIFDAAIERLAQRGDVPAGMHASTRFSDSKSVITRYTRRGRQAGIVIRVPRFKGRSGPATTFRELAKTAPIEQLRVVGIDLTGSERRASGWCLTVGPHATTALVHSDEELIQRTLESHPDLVSIDSPLSLPTGRTSVSDDDPGRASAGIMRRCERILRQRGVSVYPCLIPSMQRLTERGMQLATTLRSRGVPVIESYPGAAQDILSIPRKRASLELLSSGLSDFGLVGPWTNETATHDELDAITSSLVGLFFWAGRFEALGNEEEGYLIVPALKPDEQVWAERTVIGISGPIAAGKTTAAKVLEQRGFHYARFSEVLAEILRDRDVAITRESLQQVGDEVHRNPGQRWLCERLVSCLPMRGDIVIDGLRHPEDHSYLVERYGPTFRHVHIEAPLEWRRTRYTSLGHAPEEFDRAMSHPVEANVDTLEKLAHERIANVGSVAELGTKIGAATGLQVRKS